MKSAKTKKSLSAEQREELLATLQARFEKNPARHKGITWAKVQARLEADAPHSLFNPALLTQAAKRRLPG